MVRLESTPLTVAWIGVPSFTFQYGAIGMTPEGTPIQATISFTFQYGAIGMCPY